MSTSVVSCLLTVSGYTGYMQLTIQVQLLPAVVTLPSGKVVDQPAVLRATVERFNEAANWVAGELFAAQITNKRLAQKLVYRELRDRFLLTAQTAILVIHRVCEAYKRDRSIRPIFSRHAAITYDPRVMRFIGLDKVNLWSLAGRLVVPILIGKYQREKFTTAARQSDLVLRKDGKWFLLVTVDVPEATPIPVTDFLGVDLGIAKIAADSDGTIHSGARVEKVRRKHNLQRKRLQHRNTRGAKKKLKRMSGKEARFRKQENHRISKELVAAAKGTGRGIAVEDLDGIRDRLPAWAKDVRNKLSGWSFFQLFSFLSYKAALAGVPVQKVNARYTSQTCAVCGHSEADNRKSQAKFLCVSCGHRANADVNAALNIRARAQQVVP